MPSAVFLFIYSEVKHIAKALMRFKIENKEHTLRQIQHNEFLIRISKDPLKLKLGVFQSVLFVLESMMRTDVVWWNNSFASWVAALPSNLHTSLTNTGHLATWGIRQSREETHLFWFVGSLNHIYDFHSPRLRDSIRSDTSGFGVMCLDLLSDWFLSFICLIFLRKRWIARRITEVKWL